MRWRRKTRPEAPAVKAARRERERSQERYKQAMTLVDELRAIRERNHMKEALIALVSGENDASSD